MEPLTIPARHIAGMEILFSMPDDAMEELVAMLSGPFSSLHIKPIASAVAARVKSIERPDVNKLVSAIISLYTVRTYSDVRTSSTDEFVEEICGAMNRSGSKRLAITDDNRKRVEERLKKILSLDAFNIASKAMTLRFEHQRVFCAARILTDARPVYGSSPDNPPSGVVISHMLKIDYHEESSAVKEIYFALDADDIRELRELLDRAESKARSLKSLFDPSKLLIFE